MHRKREAAASLQTWAAIGVAPVVGAFADRLPRRALLIGLDLGRATIALLLPFIDQVWQVYLLVFLLQSASAGFMPTFQATIPVWMFVTSPAAALVG